MAIENTMTVIPEKMVDAKNKESALFPLKDRRGLTVDVGYRPKGEDGGGKEEGIGGSE